MVSSSNELLFDKAMQYMISINITVIVYIAKIYNNAIIICLSLFRNALKISFVCTI